MGIALVAWALLTVLLIVRNGAWWRFSVGDLITVSAFTLVGLVFVALAIV